jgi:hypothetical protein
VNELNSAIALYFKKWQAFVHDRQDQAFFADLQPTSIGWKTVDRADFDVRFATYRDLSDQVHLGWVNGRWLATFHLAEAPLDLGIQIIKLMERRPGSSDAVGLDHLDFYVPPGVSAKEKAAAEAGVKWSEEMNGEHCQWISLWFDGTEAKLRGDSVIDVCIAELEHCNPIQKEGKRP